MFSINVDGMTRLIFGLNCINVFIGYGGLALSIEGPSKVDIQTEDMEDGTCGVSYCPTEPGTYIVSIRFAEEHVPGKRSCMKHHSNLIYYLECAPNKV